MLRSILIENFAIIDHVSIDFERGLNIITGETGAGKSILLGALGLVLGDRVQSNIIKNPDLKCIVEASFYIERLGLESWFGEHDLDYAHHTIVRREILPGGKSRAFVNDSPVNISVIQELGKLLVDVFSQHDSLELKSSDFQLQILDAFSQNSLLLSHYQRVFKEYKSKKDTYQSLIDHKNIDERERELLSYQLQELEIYEIESWSYEQMQNELELMENSASLQEILSQASYAFKHSEPNIYQSLIDIQISISKYSHLLPTLTTAFEQAENALEELQDAFKQYDMCQSNIDFDANALLDLRSRIDYVNNLLLKHKCKDFSELITLKSNIKSKLNGMSSSDEAIDALKAELKILYNDLLAAGEKLTQSRKAVIETIENELTDKLSLLGMENCVFKIWINTSIDHMCESGLDHVRFLFSANKGVEPQDIKNAISGGERNRFMLAIKSILAHKMQLPTLIFDEIDTGVSGAIAHRVALTLEELADTHQVVAITHLPQIASKGDVHLWVYKDNSTDVTTSNIKRLNPDERLNEVAKMISGSEVTDSALKAAQELLSRA